MSETLREGGLAIRRTSLGVLSLATVTCVRRECRSFEEGLITDSSSKQSRIRFWYELSSCPAMSCANKFRETIHSSLLADLTYSTGLVK